MSRSTRQIYNYLGLENPDSYARKMVLRKINDPTYRYSQTPAQFELELNRRCGRTTRMIVDILNYIDCNPGADVLIVTPIQGVFDLIRDKIMIYLPLIGINDFESRKIKRYTIPKDEGSVKPIYFVDHSCYEMPE